MFKTWNLQYSNPSIKRYSSLLQTVSPVGLENWWWPTRPMKIWIGGPYSVGRPCAFASVHLERYSHKITDILKCSPLTSKQKFIRKSSHPNFSKLRMKRRHDNQQRINHENQVLVELRFILNLMMMMILWNWSLDSIYEAYSIFFQMQYGFSDKFHCQSLKLNWGSIALFEDENN